MNKTNVEYGGEMQKVAAEEWKEEERQGEQVTHQCAPPVDYLLDKVERLQKEIEAMKYKHQESQLDKANDVECTPELSYDRNIHIKAFIFKSLSELYVGLESAKQCKELMQAKDKLEEFQLLIEKALK
jgi:hypothetical protein